MDWTNDRDAAVNISASRMDQEADDIATALTESIARDGQTTLTAHIPFSSFKLTGLGNATTRTDAVNYGQVIDNLGRYGSVVGSNTIALTLTPALTSYQTGQVFYFTAAGDNSTTVTVNVNGISAKALKKKTPGGLVDLKPGDIKSGTIAAIAYDGTQFQLLNATVEGYRTDCRLVYTNATTLTLNRKNGDRLAINGVNEQIPAAGITLSNSGLSANTTYFVYCYMNSGTMTLEASTTAHATDSTTGLEVKSGAATRTLVGLTRTNGSSQFVQSSITLGVLSYFNRVPTALTMRFTADRTSTSTSYAEVHAEIRCSFVHWGDSDIFFAVSGGSSNSAENTRWHTAVGIETAGTVNIRGGTVCKQPPSLGGGLEMNTAFSGYARSETEGFHYATVMGRVGSGTGTWQGGSATAESDIALTVTVLG